MRASGAGSAVLLIAILLGGAPGSSAARSGHWATARRLSQTTTGVVQAAAPIVSFTPAPITGVAAVADQAFASPAVVAPAVLPNFGIPLPPPPPSPPAPPPPVPVAASEAAWSCGASAANCTASFELATVGSTAAFAVDVGAGNTDDMVIIANATNILGHVDLLVTPPAGAAVDPLLRGPWSSAHSTGAESVVAPAIAVVAGRYTVTLTATQANTTFTLQVMRDQAHEKVDIAQQAAVQQILQSCCGTSGCGKYHAWQAVANTTTLCLYPGNLCSGQNLIFLDLSGEDLQCELATHLIGDFYALERLDLSNNNLQIDFGQLAFATQQVNPLAAVSVAANNVTGVLSCDNIGASLQELDVSHSGLTGTVPACVGTAPALQSLLLGGNALSGGLPALAASSGLRTLNVSGSQLNGGVGSLAAATLLTDVDLSNNKLSDVLPELPASIQHVKMSANAFTGGVPASYGSLQTLQSLNLTANSLSGPLPAALATAPLLTELDVSHNQLTGSLGQYAMALPARGGAATTLLLDHNQLSGSVPTELGRVAAVLRGGALGLAGNELNGAFPEWLLTNSTAANGTLQLTLQGNRFTCPTAYVKAPTPVPANITNGVLCYTGTPNAMPVGSTASLAGYTPHNITDYLKAGGTLKLGGKGGSNKGLAITLPLLFILLLVAGAIGGWVWWSRRRVTASQEALPYDPETNLWKRGPGGSMYHSPPQPAAGGGGFAGALKRKARGMSPLSSNVAAVDSSVASGSSKMDLVPVEDGASSENGDRIAAVPPSLDWLSAHAAKPAAAEPATPVARGLGALRAALGFGAPPISSPRVGTSYQPARPATAISAWAGGAGATPSVRSSAAAALPPAPHPTPASTAAAASGTASWGPLGAGVSRAITWAGAGGSTGTGTGGGGAALSRMPTTPHSPRHKGAAQAANWHRIALQTAAEGRHGGRQQQQGEEADDEPRTPAYAGGLAGHARRRSPV